MRWFLGIALFVLCCGFLSVGDSPSGRQDVWPSTPVSHAETMDVFLLDFSDFFTAKIRVRNSTNSQQRIKSDRVFELLEVPGLVFLTCKIAKAYSEIHIDKYLKLLFQYTIQVNAP